ncbi:cation-translocating P-type ATPase [Streptomyces chitinivorans]|uniref:Cation-translocating P-type ATPase n=1 Tax=Streptomyces chitinivorans TaxID=1257027 RepID=A0ABW7HQ86_9ACTN|nr:cation-translocating P-type ATPase [Streptomyces chitinivorans]MDH2411306.1 cation-translocating P-type ATPase [Streptomyces chitinivorans]
MQDPPAPPAARPDGLTEEEAARRLAEGGRNEVGQSPGTPLRARVAAQLRDPLILVLLGAMVLTLLTGDHGDTAVIALVVVANTGVGVAQEVRADNAIAALTAVSAPVARVVRGGAEREVPSAEVVPGDVLLLGEGDIVPADARLLSSWALAVDESALTGESVPVDKDVRVGGPEAGALRAGTVVVRGRAVASVTATGAGSALGRIAALLHPRRGPTPLQRRLAGLGRVLAAVTVVLCLLVLLLGLALGQSLETMAVTAISLAVAAVPESLPAVVTLALALGARRMAARNALVRRLPAVETLGSVTVLATDKTGTLTEGRMVVERVWTPRGTVRLTGGGYEPAGEMLTDGGSGGDGPPAPATAQAVRDLLTAAVLCNDAALRPPHDGEERWSALGDPTEAALLAAAAKAGLDRDGVLRAHPRIGEVPFDSLRKRMTTVHREPSGGRLVCLKGAPEAVLNGSLLDETPLRLERAHREAAALSAEGHRVLAVASGPLDGAPGRWEEAESGLRLLGLAALSDPPKEVAGATVAACRAAGITPVVITGDHPATARAIAARLGILDRGPGPTGTDGAAPTEPPEVVTGRALAAGRVADPSTVRVFARTDPQQKVDIVQAWRARGAVTAMTGDGVNDGPALRQADIGVAMGRRGTEVARQAADLVLADDELRTVVAAVEEGRRVHDNIRRFLLYGMAGGAAEILVMLIGPFLGLTVPLRAGQILWINLLTHGLTGVAMGAEPVSADAMHRPPRPPGRHVLGEGLWLRILRLAALVTAASLAAALWARETGRPWQTTLFLALLAAQLGVVLGLRERLLTRENPFLPAAVLAAVVLGAATVTVPFLEGLLRTEPLDVPALAAVAAVGAAGFAAARFESRFTRGTGGGEGAFPGSFGLPAGPPASGGPPRA